MNKHVNNSVHLVLKRKTVLLSPISLLVLAACSGGSGSDSVVSVDPRTGNVTLGPLKNAKAFLDYDGDGKYDDNEPMVRTDEDGFFELTPSAEHEDATLVAIADELTVDKYAGPVSGVTLKAPASASVVSMASTIYQEAVEVALDEGTDAPTVEQVAKLLGIDTSQLSEGQNLLDFNPDADSTSDLSKSFEAASKQVATILGSMAAIADSTAGDAVSGDDAFALALASVAEVITA